MALTLSDYRVRQEICNVMADTSHTFLGHCETCSRCTAFQLALCYRLGHGIPQDRAKAIDLLTVNTRPESDLDDEIATIKHIYPALDLLTLKVDQQSCLTMAICSFGISWTNIIVKVSN